MAERVETRLDCSDVPARDAEGERNAPRAAGRLVLVDDDDHVRAALSRALREASYVVDDFGFAEPALEALEDEPGPVDVVLSDIQMPGMTGLELLEIARTRWPDVPVVLITGQGELESALQALRLGAYDYLLKPIDPDSLLIPAVRRAIEHKRLVMANRSLQRRLDAQGRAPELVGNSEPMRRLRSLIASVAPSDATILIQGESGTGKELVARAIHDQSGRASKAFVDVNCASLVDSVLQSELFGHVKGAFTGAVSARVGLFEEASGGSLFMDEIGELSSTTQAQLLRVLQEGTVRPVGSNRSRQLDTRVITATNRDLARDVAGGRFRQDLYYRLNVVTIDVPPLRKRGGDIPELATHFMRKHGSSAHLHAEAVAELVDRDWPGNVRELENVISRALIFAAGGDITPDLIAGSDAGSHRSGEADGIKSLAVAKAEFEKEYLRQVLLQTGGNLSESARLADVDRSNLRRLVRRHGLNPGQFE